VVLTGVIVVATVVVVALVVVVLGASVVSSPLPLPDSSSSVVVVGATVVVVLAGVVVVGATVVSSSPEPDPDISSVVVATVVVVCDVTVVGASVVVVVCGGTVGGFGTSSFEQVGVHPQDNTSSYSYKTSVPFLHLSETYLTSMEVGLQQEHPPSPSSGEYFPLQKPSQYPCATVFTETHSSTTKYSKVTCRWHSKHSLYRHLRQHPSSDVMTSPPFVTHESASK